MHSPRAKNNALFEIIPTSANFLENPLACVHRDKLNAAAVINACNKIYFGLTNTGSVYAWRVSLSDWRDNALRRQVHTRSEAGREAATVAAACYRERHVRISGLISSPCRLNLE